MLSKFNYIDKEGEFMTSYIIKENENMSADKSIDYYFVDYGEKNISKIVTILGNSYAQKYNKLCVIFYGSKRRILRLLRNENI